MSDRFLALFIIGCGLLISSFLGGALWWYVTTERAAAIQQAQDHTAAMTNAYRLTIGQRLEAHDSTLRMLEELVRSDAPADLLQSVLDARVATDSDIMDILILDAEGHITLWTGRGTPPDVRERPYYTAHHDPSAPPLSLTQPMASLVHADMWFFALSRAVRDPASALRAVVVVIVDIDGFSNPFTNNKPTAETTLVVAGLDGTVYFRLPRIAGDSGMVLAPLAALQGNVPNELVRIVQSEFDGRDRVAVVKRLPGYPLVVSATSDLAAVQQQGQALARTAILVFLLLVGIGAGIVAFLLFGLYARTKARGEREKMLISLQYSNAEMVRLAEIMAHHFQEPSRRLISFAQRLEASPALAADADAVQSVAFINEQARRLRALTQDIQQYLVLSQMDFSTAPAVSSDAAVKEAAAHCTRNSDVDFTLHISPPLPPVRFPERTLTTLFTALLENAVKYRRPDVPLRIEVSAEVRQGRALFRVADNGSGIAPAYRERVFALFVRLVPNSIPGTGMGLALLHKCVHSAGGQVWVEDGLDGGACIAFDLPLAQPDTHKENTP